MRRNLATISLVIAFCHSLIAQTVGVWCPAPEYPESARARGLEGNGMFLLRLRPDGTTKSVEVLSSTGWTILDRAAIAAFRQWRFKPGPGVHQVKVPATFTAHGAVYPLRPNQR
jgi:TonB family protein